MNISALPFASLISGGGTTMQALGLACQDGGQLYGRAKLALVVSNSTTAGGMAKANALGIPVELINPANFPTPEEFGAAIIVACRMHGVQLICQNGWLPLTPINVIAAYARMIINQHPAPVPEFGGRGMYGKRPHCARLEFYRRVQRDPWTEAIAQWVAPTFDDGSVLHKIAVPILPEDDTDSLQRRVLPIEHQVQIQVLEMFCADCVREEWPPPASLVRLVERPILDECKRLARQRYPNG